ncbi:hypothetical protein V8C86DRAFT_610467 [Haematococcus lacustris]
MPGLNSALEQVATDWFTTQNQVVARLRTEDLEKQRLPELKELDDGQLQAKLAQHTNLLMDKNLKSKPLPKSETMFKACIVELEYRRRHAKDKHDQSSEWLALSKETQAAAAPPAPHYSAAIAQAQAGIAHHTNPQPVSQSSEPAWDAGAACAAPNTLTNMAFPHQHRNVVTPRRPIWAYQLGEPHHPRLFAGQCELGGGQLVSLTGCQVVSLTSQSTSHTQACVLQQCRQWATRLGWGGRGLEKAVSAVAALPCAMRCMCGWPQA